MSVKAYQYFADISSNNGWVNIPDYSRAGHVMIAIKASQGQGYRNPYHYNQCKTAHEFGLTVLHYHWIDNSSIVGQIENFRTVYLPVWRNGDYAGFDIEQENTLTSTANEVLSDYYKMTGREPVGYVPKEKLNGLIIPGKRLWYPNYNEGASNVSGPGYKTWAKQFTDGKEGPQPHRCTGIGNCDISTLGLGPARALYIRKLITKRRK